MEESESNLDPGYYAGVESNIDLGYYIGVRV